MKRKSTLLVISLIFVVSGAVTNTAVAAHWYPVGSKGTKPELDPAGIQVGGGLWYGKTFTITVVQGDTVDLRALSKDSDTKREYDGCVYTYTPVWETTCAIVWSSDGGGLPDPLRRESGVTITWTAPTLDPNETSRTVKITATPDDNSTAAPGSRPAGDTGNRDDNPNNGKRIYIYFKVIKNCPTDASLGSECSPTFDWMFANVTVGPQEDPVKTAGFKTVQTQVSGGTPPNPPNNWNGMFIKESLDLHPIDDGTAEDPNFEMAGTKASCCTASVQGFVVGTELPDFGSCSRPAQTNRFWDNHTMWSNIPLLKEGLEDKTVICQQKHYCKNTQLLTAGANNAFSITRTFHENYYDPDGEGPLDPYRVSEVTIAKTTD